MSEPIYRLLNPLIDAFHEGDEIYCLGLSGPNRWLVLSRSNTGIPLDPGRIYRRLIPEPKWILVKEKPPEFPCWGFDGQRVFHSEGYGSGHGTVTHWMPAERRPEPPQQSEQEQDERALQQCWQRIKLLDATGKQLIEETWRTCLAYERARKK